MGAACHVSGPELPAAFGYDVSTARICSAALLRQDREVVADRSSILDGIRQAVTYGDSPSAESPGAVEYARERQLDRCSSVAPVFPDV